MSIKAICRKLFLATSAAAVLMALPVLAADGDKSNIKGLITAVQGNEITIKDANNATQTIKLTPATTVKSVSGLVGAQRSKVEPTALIPGLPISADVVAEGSGFIATGISFKTGDFKTAQQISAGIASTSEQANANKARLENFGTAETLASLDVTFPSGSTAISAKGRSDLLEFAAKAKATKGYIVQTTGFTDSTGSAEKNQALSKARANNVVNFLQEQGGLMPARVAASDGMGVASDAGVGSNANARKVTVTLLVDKGVAGTE